MFGMFKSHLPKDWQHLKGSEILEQIDKDSYSKTQAIFKHSTRCGISQHVLDNTISDWTIDSDKLTFYLLDLLAYRPISNEISQHWNIPHQSPQLILIRNGKAIYHASHHSIQVAEIAKKIG